MLKSIRTINKELKEAPKLEFTTARWGIFQFVLSISFFCGGICIGLLSILLAVVWSKQVMDMLVWTILVCIITVLFAAGLCMSGYFAYRAYKLGIFWLDTGSKDPTATQRNIKELKDIIECMLGIKFCTKCGFKIDNRNTFCINCGYRLRQ